MYNRLRSHAYVRTLLRNLKRTGSEMDLAVRSVTQPPAYIRPLVSRAPAFDPSGPADLLIRNARVFPSLAAGEAPVTIAIKNNRIAHVGADIAGLADGRTATIDAGGNSVIPGLCDCHLHLMVGAEHHQGCVVEDVEDPDTLRRRLKSFVRLHPDNSVYYVYGLHYTDPPLIPPGTARRMLDDIVADKPMFVYAHDLHTGWANTRALETADLMRRMPPYPGLIRELDMCGNIEPDGDGYPSGELREPPVYFIVEEALRRRFPLTVEQKRSFIEQACLSLASLGLTSVHNMGLSLPEEDVECLMLLLDLEDEGRLPLRVYSSCSVVPDEFMLEDVLRAADVRDRMEQAVHGGLAFPDLHSALLGVMKTALGARQGEKRFPSSDPHALWHRFLDDFARIITQAHLAEHEVRGEMLRERSSGGRRNAMGMVQCKTVKLFMDGVVEKDTAYRLDRHPLPGIPAFSGRELDMVVFLADRLGLQAAAHCIGNGAVNAMLNSIEWARQENAAIDHRRGGRVRHRIEHIEMCAQFDIPRFSALEVIASMQALHERPPVTLWHRKVPEVEWPTAFAWRSLLESGANLVFGSDWPIVSCNCFEGMRRATARKPWKPGMIDQHLDLEQALAAFTTHAAHAEYSENIKGRIREGMLADLVVLSDNLEERRGDLEGTEVVCTVSNGRVVYSAQ